ncbi:hypothetical protein GC194_09675 [bacterium]|nr:hypothetical protein [bacterium]
MKHSKKYANHVFWSIVLIMAAIVVTVTAGTYFQYKMAMNVPEVQPKEQVSMAYSVVSQAKGVWFLVGTLLH